MLTFQDLIQKLTTFWTDKGCILHQPYDVEVGAGTYNPVSFLRSLGPEPYSAVYVESSRRPQDGRYALNPNRTQLFHQLQVVIKPSPLDIQKIYLESLEAIGFDLKKHDIRFVHDDWESPTLGAWGLGWEVWIDGMEITQYTYFQAVGGVPVKPVCIELAYGLERLSMLIQNVDNFFDMQWNDTYTYGDILKESELEWSHYNFDEASVNMWDAHFRDYEKEALSLLEKDFPIPAYDFVLKATHAFNILESRGVLAVTERMGFISRIRELAQQVAAKYIKMREKKGFPLLSLEKPKKEKTHPVSNPFAHFSPDKVEDFLLEIGSEQLPATFVPIGMRNLENTIKTLLNDHGISFEEIKVYGTPRRLSVYVKDLSCGTQSKDIEKKGPAIERVFEENGKLSKQGMGFLKSLGMEEKQISLDAIKNNKIPNLEVRSMNGGDYLFAKIHQKGLCTGELLIKHLPKRILDLSFPKKMRWSDLDLQYARPLSWIVALFGTEVIPFQIGNLHSDRVSHGHAQICPFPIKIAHPKDYLKSLKEHYILVDVQERKKEILRQLASIETKTQSMALMKPRVLNEVLHLVEWPELTHTSFDESFLKAPAEVLISEMVLHQRYFPLADEHGILKNLFIITADNHPNDVVRKGNQKVLSARLSDGVFLYEQDLKTSLDAFAKKLKAITFQKDLGTMFDKVKRLIEISSLLCTYVPNADETKAKRAAELCKADLSSALVDEFPDLQGIIGKNYALVQKEDREVAEAIEEHWLPKLEGGALPKTITGTILSLADKIDNLIGYFSVGLIPTSSSDPYALRRQTLGFVKILIENTWSIDLPLLLEKACKAFPKLHGELHKQQKLIDAIISYITTRARTVYEEYGFKKDEIAAILGEKCINPYDQYCRLKALSAFRKKGDSFTKLFEVYKRAKGQLGLEIKGAFDPSLLKEKQEKSLAETLSSMEKSFGDKLSKADYHGAFELLSSLHMPMADLFDNVKILSDDPKLQQNRLALLQKVFGYFSKLLDFGKIQEHR